MNEITIIDLTKVAQQSQIDPHSAAILSQSFSPFFERANALRNEAMQTVVTGLGQPTAMKRSRELRLIFQKVRTDADKKREEMKRESLRYGNAVQGAYNLIRLLVEPIEEHLKAQEDFAVRLEEQRLDETRQLREIESGPYWAFFPQTVDLGTITDEVFASLLNGAKLQKQAADAERKRQEDEAAEKLRIELEAREAQRLDNIRLKAEAEAQAEIMREEREAAENERRKAQAVLDAEREAAQKAQREIQAALDAEREKAQAIEAAQRREKEEAERIALEAAQAPDLEKMRAYAAKIRAIEMPEITGESVRQLRAGLKMIHDGLEMIER